MAAAFVFGPAGALIGFGLGAWLIWRWAEDPGRHGVIGMALAAGFVALLVAGGIAFSPRYDPGIEWPKGMKGHAVTFHLRCGSGTLEAVWDPRQVRREGDLAVVPAAFTLHDLQTLWLFAVIEHGRQLGTHTIDLKQPLTETSGWSEWQPMEGGIEVRFRTAVVAR